MEAVVSAFNDVERGPRFYGIQERLQQIEVCEPIPWPLEKEHGSSDLSEVGTPIGRVSPWRMQGEAEEDQASNPRQGFTRSSRRRHAPPHRLSSREERQIRRKLRGRRDG